MRKTDTATVDFLPRDAGKALVDLKEILYARLKGAKGYIKQNGDNCHPVNFGIVSSIQNEIQFLENVIDLIERS